MIPVALLAALAHAQGRVPLADATVEPAVTPEEFRRRHGAHPVVGVRLAGGGAALWCPPCGELFLRDP